MLVQFIKDTSKMKIENIKGSTFLIYHEHEDYKLPNISNIEYMKFNKFKTVYSVLEFDMLIFLGLNRIITSSNRCNMVNDFIQTMTRNIPKISIDTSPFIGEPWRVWYHYDVCNCNKFNIPHGYAIETEWKHWFYRDRNDCRLSGDNIKLFINNTYSNLKQIDFKYNFYEPNNNEFKYYKNLKNEIFNKYNSKKLWINNLLKLSNKHFGLKLNMNSYIETNSMLDINIPNLGIYRFVIEENLRRMNIYNAVVGSKN